MIEVEGDGARYWPRWRGPSGQGLVADGAYTDAWSPTSRVQWKVALPGSGNSSPVVWGEQIFVTTARDRGRRLSMLAFNRADGKVLWETFIPQDGVEGVHEKNGYASATPATDGQRVYASFGRHGLAAFDLSGKLLWHRRFGVIDNYHGPAGSPVLYKDRIFLYQDQNPTTQPVGVRRRLRQGHREDAVADAAHGNRRVGHARRHRRRRARRAGRVGPAARGGLRSRHRARAVDRARQHLRSDSDAGRRPWAACSPRRGAPVRPSPFARAGPVTSPPRTSPGARRKARPSCLPASSSATCSTW